MRNTLLILLLLSGRALAPSFAAHGEDGGPHWPCVRIADFPRYSWRG